MKKAFQIKVSLKYSSPLIWREILIDPDTTFIDLHEIIQIAMGWENDHLWEFRTKEYSLDNDYYELEEEEKEELDEKVKEFIKTTASRYNLPKQKDSYKTKISDIFNGKKETFKYTYDFGDSWVHDITIGKLKDIPDKQQLPYCLKGEVSCPPEDCGGIWGYYHKIEVLADPKHKDYHEVSDWIGEGTFNTNEFDIDNINEQFKDW